jgi:hypothetical protein
MTSRSTASQSSRSSRGTPLLGGPAPAPGASAPLGDAATAATFSPTGRSHDGNYLAFTKVSEQTRAVECSLRTDALARFTKQWDLPDMSGNFLVRGRRAPDQR